MNKFYLDDKTAWEVISLICRLNKSIEIDTVVSFEDIEELQ